MIADDDWAEVLAERDRFRQHSIILNSLCYRMAVELGDIADGAPSYFMDDGLSGPMELLERLLAQQTFDAIDDAAPYRDGMR